MRTSFKKRGALIIIALLLFTILLVLGLGLMSSQTARRRSALAQLNSVQARELCLAAWQDARVKLSTDILFPPAGTHESFSYSEDVYDSDENIYGSYTVNIDLRFQKFMHVAANGSPDTKIQIGIGFYIVTCIGKLGDRGLEPTAERVMIFEIDQKTFQTLRVTDLGSL